MSNKWSLNLINGDCAEKMRDLAPNSVDAIVTDPPYGLAFMGAKWDNFGVKSCGNDSIEERKRKAKECRETHKGCGNYPNSHSSSPSRDEMANFQSAMTPVFAEALRVAKPGAHLLAFGGTRTYHRLACAIEDAGWEVRDCIMWVYGSGFPKSMDVGKAIDTRGGNPHLAQEIAKAIRAAREVRGWSKSEADEHFCHGTTNWSWYEGRNGKCRPPSTDMFARIVAEWTELASLADKVATAEREIIGKSAHKSGIGHATAGHYTVGGTKAVRVNITAPATPEAAAWSGWGTCLKPACEPIVVARKPLDGTVAANVLKYGTGAINIDGCRVATSDELSTHGDSQCRDEKSAKVYGSYKPAKRGQTAGQTLGRFPANLIHDGSDEVLALFPDSKGQCGAVKGNEPIELTRGIYGKFSGDRLPCAPRGDAGSAARFFYCAKASRAERGEGNVHPTVKPLALMRYLVRLVTRKGGIVLDPFMGSGTTGVAAIQEGMNFVGIERDPHYYEIASRRVNDAKPLPPTTTQEELPL